jgi:4-amino-4-deoxy-L-arabinose transferase-like glycosyltransferase
MIRQRLRSLKPKLSGLAAASLLGTMSLVMLGSAWEDALTMDEPIHLTAGYTYLRFRDARLNPEHPPLLKLLAALPLLLLPLHFPLTHPAWRSDNVWQIWYPFLYESGNDPHQITAQARLVPMALTVALGGLLFRWTRRWAGAIPALLTLVCYVCSPTILAHRRLVTTDVPAALGVALAGSAFSRFLTDPSRRAALGVGLTLGAALLLTLSLVLLVPLFVALILLWVWLAPERRHRCLTGSLIMGSIAALLVLLPYLWMSARYPPADQVRDAYMALFDYAGGPLGWTGTATAREDFAALVEDRTRDLRACARRLAEARLAHLPRCAAELVIFVADQPMIRAWGAYLLGLLLTLWRASAGYVTYFLGEVTRSGRWSYFPIVYAIKEPLPFHLMAGLALLLTLPRGGSRSWRLRALAAWLRSHPTEVLMLGWISLYWSVALRAKLNIGVRHLLPVFPFTLMLVSHRIGRWLEWPPGTSARLMDHSSARRAAVAVLLLWQVVSVLRLYPSFLAYFNEAVGGPAGGARYVADSNLDWGQDLRRLRAFVEAHQIDSIAVDYFGGGSVAYELGAKAIPWSSVQGPYPGWLAISATVLTSAQGRWDPALGWQPDEAYGWLHGQAPVATIGYSIVVFDLRHLRAEPKPEHLRGEQGSPAELDHQP